MTIGATLQLAIADVWADHLAGRISDAEAAHRDGLLRSKQSSRARPINGSRAIGAAPRPTKFRPRRYQRSPDREKSRHRRRGWARATDVYGPSNLFAAYTEGETAVLRVILCEAARHGVCDLHINTIAAKAGVCRTLVQRAIYWARELHHITWTERRIPGSKSKTNLICVVSPEWLDFIKRESRARTGCTSAPGRTKVPPTKIQDLSKRARFDRPRPVPVERLHGIRLEAG
jgi:hypothetical protein